MGIELPHAIAIMPWVRISEKAKFGKVRFIPWDAGIPETGICFLTAEKARSLLSCYREFNGESIKKATLVIHEDQGTSGRMDDSIIEDIFNASRILAFTALSKNKFFDTGQYLNSTHFSVIIQGFTYEANHIALESRRRDGVARILVENYEKVLFVKPQQCHSNDMFDPDLALLRALERLKDDEVECFNCILESITTFVLANTDESSFPFKQELIMHQMALEWLLECLESEGQGAIGFSKGMAELMAEFSSSQCDESKHKESEHLKMLYAENERAKKVKFERIPLIGLWAWEFYKLRNDYVHGNDLNRRPWVWTEDEHLLFACFIYPLAIKVVLNKKGLYSFSKDDCYRLAAIDYLLNDNGWFERGTENDTIKWQELFTKAAINVMLSKEKEAFLDAWYQEISHLQSGSGTKTSKM